VFSIGNLDEKFKCKNNNQLEDVEACQEFLIYKARCSYDSTCSILILYAGNNFFIKISLSSKIKVSGFTNIN